MSTRSRWLLGVVLSALVIPGSVDGCGGDGTSSASSSSTSSSSTGGTTTGGGGHGGAGGGCLHCGQAALFSNPQGLCPASQQLFDAYQTCVCGPDCTSSCASACNGGPQTGPCAQCAHAQCYGKETACGNDL